MAMGEANVSGSPIEMFYVQVYPYSLVNEDMLLPVGIEDIIMIILSLTSSYVRVKII